VKYQVEVADEKIELEVEKTDEGARVRLGDETKPVDLVRIGESAVYSLILGDRSYEASVHRRDKIYRVVLEGSTYDARVMDERALRLAAAGGGDEEKKGGIVKAPMPGIVIGIAVEEGSVVEPGQGVLTLEAMKMENELKSAVAGVVKEIKVEVGQGVTQGEDLIVIE
jgi:biotin carboxyl carrier protein